MQGAAITLVRRLLLTPRTEQLTLSTSMPLNSTIVQVFPTEKEPLEFSFDLWMKPAPSLDPATRQFTRRRDLPVVVTYSR